MINLNGKLYSDSNAKISLENRGYKYGDALFETVKVVHGKILFWEDHYFRLMASMRILRMEIPMTFTMEFIEAEIIKTLEANKLLNETARVRLNIDRGEGGKYFTSNKNINYSIVTEALKESFYTISDNNNYTIDIFKDYFIAPGLLSTLKTNNKAINVVGSIYANENKLDNCLLLNTNKSIVEVLNGNLFLVKDNVVKTPPIIDGCLKGIMRKQIIETLTTIEDYNFIEDSISPFELQQADELFITNVIMGIQPVTNYRKKTYKNEVSKRILEKLNVKIRLS